MRPVGGKIDGRRVYTGQVVVFDKTSFPMSSLLVPRPKQHKAIVYNSDTDQEGEKIADAESDDTETSESENSEVTTSSESEDSDDGGDSMVQNYSPPPREPIESKQPKVPIQEYIPDGKIGDKDGFEIEEILDQRTRKKNNRKQKIYLVRWKGNWPTEWIPARSMSAKDLIAKYEKKIGMNLVTKTRIFMNVQLRCNAGSIELITNAESKVPELNPFKDLFNPLTQTKIPDPVGKK